MAAASRHLTRLSSETIVYGLSQALVQFSGLILTPLYGHQLTPAELGAVALANTLVGLFGMVLVFGLDNSTHRWYWDSDDAGDRELTLNAWFWPYVVVSAGCALLLVALYRPIGAYLELSFYGVLLVASQLVSRAVANVAANWFRLQRRPWMVLLVNLGLFCSTTGLTVVLLLVLDRGVLGVFEAQAASLLLQGLVAAWLLRRHLDWRRFALPRLRAMLRFALPLVPAGLLLWGINLSDRMLLERIGGTQEVGVYQIASMVAMLIGLPVIAFQQAWSPFALSIHHQASAGRLYSAVLFGGALIASVAALWCVVLSPWIIGVIASPSYRAATQYMPWLAYSHVLMALFSVVAIGSNIAKNSRSVAAAVAWGAAAKLAGALLLIPHFGAAGVVASTVIGLAAMVCWMYVRSQRDFPLPLKGWRSAVATTSLFALSLLGGEPFRMFGSAGIWLTTALASFGAAWLAIRVARDARGVGGAERSAASV